MSKFFIRSHMKGKEDMVLYRARLFIGDGTVSAEESNDTVAKGALRDVYHPVDSAYAWVLEFAKSKQEAEGMAKEDFEKYFEKERKENEVRLESAMKYRTLLKKALEGLNGKSGEGRR